MFRKHDLPSRVPKKITESSWRTAPITDANEEDVDEEEAWKRKREDQEQTRRKDLANAEIIRSVVRKSVGRIVRDGDSQLKERPATKSVAARNEGWGKKDEERRRGKGREWDVGGMGRRGPCPELPRGLYRPFDLRRSSLLPRSIDTSYFYGWSPP